MEKGSTISLAKPVFLIFVVNCPRIWKNHLVHKVLIIYPSSTTVGFLTQLFEKEEWSHRLIDSKFEQLVARPYSSSYVCASLVECGEYL